MDLRRLITIARAWLPLMVVAAIACGAIAFGVSSLQSKVYEARTSLIVGQALSASNPDYTQLLVAQNLSSTYAAVAKTRRNLEAVIGQLDLPDTPEQLAQRVQVESPSGSTLLSITAQDSSPAQAAAIANALAGQLVAASPSIQGREAQFQESIDKDLAATQEQIDATQDRADTLNAETNRSPSEDAELISLEGRLATLRSAYATLLGYSSASSANLLTVVDPAVAPEFPVLPRVALNTVLAALFGLLAVAAVAVIAEQLDDSIKDPEAIEEVTALSTLGTIARMKSGRGRSEIYQLAALLYPRSNVTESYRKLRANVEFASVDTPLRSLLVASSVPGEGKSVTAANLAVVFAQTGRNVLLVDADLRKPGVHTLFNLVNTDGLTTLLRDPTIRWDAIAHATEVPTLRVLTTGPLPPNPAELIGSQRMQTVFDQVKWANELVIFDSAPLMAVTDSAVLSTYTDGTILVIDASRSKRKVVRLARESLDRAGARVLGAVLNRVEADKDPGYGTYYGVADAAPQGVHPTAAASGASLPAAGRAPAGRTPRRGRPTRVPDPSERHEG